MSGKSLFLTRLVAIALSLGMVVPFSGAVLLYPTEAAAKAPKKSTLPKPYVSKALKAVLMPVTKEVARKFKLAKGSKGVMIVSVKPDGIGKLAGLKPGDVISTILGRQVKKPSDVDTIIAYFLAGGTTDYKIGGTRKNGRTYRAATYITPTFFYDPIDVYTVTSWSSFSYETYSYSEYVSYYSQDIYTSYERSETYIQETITETSFVSEMTSETNYEYASYDEQVVDGSYVEGGSGSVWQDGESDVAYGTADDPTLLEVPNDPATDDADIFTADQGDPDFDTASVETDSGAATDAALYDDPGTAASQGPAATEDSTATEDLAATDDMATTEDPTATGDPSASEDTAMVEDPSASEDPAASEYPAVSEDPSIAEDPAASEDSSAFEDPVPGEDPAASEDLSASENMPASEDPSGTEDATASEDPAPEDQGYTDQPAADTGMDSASGADPACAGEIIDGACVETSSGSSGDDTAAYEDTSGGDSGGGEEFVPEQ